VKIGSMAVFCGSATGKNPAFALAARDLGRLLAERQIRLVYGGASIGLMGQVADGALAAGGEVLGVIPHRLSVKEITHAGLTDLVMTETMHERKAKMADASDGFIALPGGWGTLDELFEILTWAQLSIHRKPVGILNLQGFFDPLLALINHLVEEGFVPSHHREVLITSERPEDLLERMTTFQSPIDPDWAIDPSLR